MGLGVRDPRHLSWFLTDQQTAWLTSRSHLEHEGAESLGATQTHIAGSRCVSTETSHSRLILEVSSDGPSHSPSTPRGLGSVAWTWVFE